MKIKKCMQMLGIWCLTVALLLSGVACGSTQPSTKDNNCLTIVCTTYVAKEIAKALTQNWLSLPTGHGYDSLQIQILGQGGRDLHSYEPTAADLVALHQADVFIYVGESAEPWVKSALGAVDSQSVVLNMMEACEAFLLPVGHESDNCSPDHDHTHDEGAAYDEHMWMSLRTVRQLTSALSAKLQVMLPHAAELIGYNEGEYLKELKALDEAYSDMVANAKRTEVLVADRNPFTYLMHDYGITCHAAFPGCSSETEASFATQAQLLETIKQQKLPYIFQTEGGESSIAKTLSEATGAKVLTLHACQVMTDDERYEMTYIDIMKNNLENLKKALWEDDLPINET